MSLASLRVLAHIYSDGGHCVNGGGARHGGAPSPEKPPAHSHSRSGQERGPVHPIHVISLPTIDTVRKAYAPSLPLCPILEV
jgi:hypothetical protein